MFARLQCNEALPARVTRKRCRCSNDQAKIAQQRRAVRLAGVGPTCEERGRARAARRDVQKIVSGDDGEHEVVIDHLVVVERRVGGRHARLHALQHSVLADDFLMRDLPRGVQAREHGGESGLEGVRLEHRRQQPQRHQRIAAEVGVEPPRPGEQFLPVAEEREHPAQTDIGGGGRRQQLVLGEGCQWRVAREGGHPQTQLVIGGGGELYWLPLAAGDRAAEHLDRQRVTCSAVETPARPGDTAVRYLRCGQDLGRHLARILVVADHADAARDRLCDRDGSADRDEVGRHPVHHAAVRQLAVRRDQGHVGRPGERGAVSVEPDRCAAVARREGDHQPRRGPRGEHEMRRDGPLPVELVERTPFGRREAQRRRRGLERRACRRENRAGEARGDPQAGCSAVSVAGDNGATECRMTSS